MRESGRIRCPYPNCDYIGHSMMTVKVHYTKVHGLDHCPLCNKKFKNLIAHLSMMSYKCDKHRVLYGVLAKMCSDRVRECRRYAEEVLSVEA